MIFLEWTRDGFPRSLRLPKSLHAIELAPHILPATPPVERH